MATSRLGDAVSDGNAHSQFLGCSKSYLDEILPAGQNDRVG